MRLVIVIVTILLVTIEPITYYHRHHDAAGRLRQVDGWPGSKVGVAGVLFSHYDGHAVLCEMV